MFCGQKFVLFIILFCVTICNTSLLKEPMPIKIVQFVTIENNDNVINFSVVFVKKDNGIYVHVSIKNTDNSCQNFNSSNLFENKFVSDFYQNLGIVSEHILCDNKCTNNCYVEGTIYTDIQIDYLVMNGFINDSGFTSHASFSHDTITTICAITFEFKNKSLNSKCKFLGF